MKNVIIRQSLYIDKTSTPKQFPFLLSIKQFLSVSHTVLVFFLHFATMARTKHTPRKCYISPSVSDVEKNQSLKGIMKRGVRKGLKKNVSFAGEEHQPSVLLEKFKMKENEVIVISDDEEEGETKDGEGKESSVQFKPAPQIMTRKFSFTAKDFVIFHRG